MTRLATQLPKTPSSVETQPSHTLAGARLQRCAGRMCPADTCSHDQPVLLRRQPTAEHNPATAPPAVYETLRGAGRPLDPATRAFMEPRFGHDFSQVRVHTDSRASTSAAAVHSWAYTVGHDIVFTAGSYAPGTSEGQRLLAHELTHVIQQRPAGGPHGGPGERHAGAQTKLEIGQPGDACEREADRIAHQVTRTPAAPSPAHVHPQPIERMHTQVGLRLMRQPRTRGGSTPAGIPSDEKFGREAEHPAVSARSRGGAVAHTSRRGRRMVQRALGNEPAGGCAVCQRAPEAGKLAHRVAQQLFVQVYGRRIIPEAPYYNPQDEENGRLDLLRFDESSTPIVIEIGEIKPDNDKGVQHGKRDLGYYHSELRRWFPEGRFTLDYLDVPAPSVTAPFRDNESPYCPPQTISVRQARLGAQPGLYLYSCAPPGSQISESCCQGVPPPVPVPELKKVEEEKPAVDLEALAYATAAATAFGLAPRLGRTLTAFAQAPAGAAAVAAGPPVTLQVAPPAAPPSAAGGGTAAARAGAGAPRTLAKLGARVGPLGLATTITAVTFTGVARYAYGGVVPGAVAAGLAEVYSAMGAAAAKIARWSPDGWAVLAAHDVATDEDVRVRARSELQGILHPLHEGIDEAWRAVQAAAQRFRAIGDWLRQAEDVPDFLFAALMVNGRYPSPRSLQLAELARFMLLDADKLTKLMQRLYDDREAIITNQSHYVMQRGD